MFRDVAVRTVTELSSKIRVPGVPEGFCDDVNEHMVEGDWMAHHATEPAASRSSASIVASEVSHALL